MAAMEHLVLHDGEFNMSDLVVVALIVGFFLVSGLYVHFCDKL